jgi:hypothetical protein
MADTKPLEAAKPAAAPADEPVVMGYYEVVRGIWPKHWCYNPDITRRKALPGWIVELPEEEAEFFAHCLQPSSKKKYQAFREAMKGAL